MDGINTPYYGGSPYYDPNYVPGQDTGGNGFTPGSAQGSAGGDQYGGNPYDSGSTSAAPQPAVASTSAGGFGPSYGSGPYDSTPGGPAFDPAITPGLMGWAQDAAKKAAGNFRSAVADDQNYGMRKPQIDETIGGDVASKLLNRDSRGDQWDKENPGAFATPGQLETFWDGVSGGWNNRPEATTLAVDAYNKYEANRNELAPLPGLDPYYDRARERTSADLNRQLAARGGYNSSRGLGILSDATQGLNAEQANREADYALARSADARAWGIGGSQAANLADSSTRGAGQLDLQQLLGYGELAGAAQGAEQGRLLTDLGVDMGLDAQEFGDWAGAVDAASTAGGARRERIGQLFDMMFGVGGTASGMAGDSYDASISDILEMNDAELAALLGETNFAVGRDDAARQEFLATLGALKELMSNGGSGGSGGGVAGGSPTGGGAGIR